MTIDERFWAFSNNKTVLRPMTDKPTLNGCQLTPQELELVRAEIESRDMIEHMTDEILGLIASQWPHLLPKLHPPKPN